MSRFQLGEFWLALRGDTWTIAWFDKERRQTRRLSTGLRDFEEAKRKLAEHALKHTDLRGAEPAEVPVRRILEDYYENHAKGLPSGDYAQYALGYWLRAFGDSTVADLTPAALEAFAESLKATGKLSGGTVNRILGVGRAGLARGVRRGQILRPVFVPTVKAAPPKLPRATQAQVAALLNATDGDLAHVRTWLLLSIGTLARPEALLELTREQVDTDLGRIDLNQPGRIQSRKVRPVVPLTPTVRALVESLPATGLLVRYREGPLVDIRMGFDRARKRAGLPAGISPYTIRRTMASELRRRGVPPWEIAGFLGHSARDFRTTEVYAEYAPDYLGQAANVIEAYFAELAPLLDFELPRSKCVPERVPPMLQVEANSLNFPINLVGATGIEPATTTMSTYCFPGFVRGISLHYQQGAPLEYKNLPAFAFQLRSNLRSTEDDDV